ncbi:hypothetical protein, partial [Clostridium perfringens]|uniref:hypothetical protein n=1 Tax=Clostridium perfringens TaxID=1502 RepID=UPI003755379B
NYLEVVFVDIVFGHSLSIAPVLVVALATMHMVGARKAHAQHELFLLFGHFGTGVVLLLHCLRQEPR